MGAGFKTGHKGHHRLWRVKSGQRFTSSQSIPELETQRKRLRRRNAAEPGSAVYDQLYAPGQIQTAGAEVHFDLLCVPSTDANRGAFNPAFELYTWFRWRIRIGVDSWNGDSPDAAVLRCVHHKREMLGHMPRLLEQPSL